MTPYNQVDPSWFEAIPDLRKAIDNVFAKLEGVDFIPHRDRVLVSLSTPIDEVKVLILGQDPYPTPGYAIGYSFAVDSEISKLPKSLINIFKEYQSDLSRLAPTHGDLSSWVEQGVMLLNRSLTVAPGSALSHESLGWRTVTDLIARELGKRNVVAILWGKKAQEISHYFPATQRIESSHPSPLAAHRGFFGSKPFSRANNLLVAMGRPTIDW